MFYHLKSRGSLFFLRGELKVNIKSNYKLFYLAFIVPFLFLFNNCSQGFLVDQDGQLSASSIIDPNNPSPEIDTTPWPEVNCSEPKSFNKIAAIEMTEPKQRFPEELKNETFYPDDDLLVTINNECFTQFGHQSDLTENLKLLSPNAKFTTFSYKVSKKISGLEVYQEMLKDSCLVEIDRDYQIKIVSSAPNDPSYSKQNYLNSIHHPEAFAQAYNSNNGINKEVRVAVIDTGVQTTHPDLSNMILMENGKVVAPSDNYLDSGIHGTHVSGIIAAQANNNQGISGTAGAYIKIMPVKVSNDGQSVNTSTVTNGIYWAADNGAKVINMSLGGAQTTSSFLEAIKYANSKGVFVIAAAGNDGKQLNSSFLFYPAAYTVNVSGMLSVGSFDASTKKKSSFSNYSSTYVDIMAPGSDSTYGKIYSTIPNGYGSLEGTSMASPVVAGAAAMIIGLAESRGFSITPEQVKKFFIRGSQVDSSFSNFAIGGKLLDLKKLMDSVADDTGLPLTSNLDRSQAAGLIEIASHSESLGLATGSDLQLKVGKTSSSSELVNYEWLKDGKVISDQNQSILTIKNIGLSDKGVYQARISSGLTKKLTKAIKVNVANCSN